MKNAAEDSIRIAREYMDSLQVESRLLGAEEPSSAFEFLGETFSTPIMTAALSHIDLKCMAEGAVLAGAAASIGMGDNETLKGVLGTGAKVMKIVKPYANRVTTYSGPDATQHFAGRVGNPLDIANMVLFLASDKAGFITGENICIDGGMTKHMIYHNDFGWKLEKTEE